MITNVDWNRLGLDAGSRTVELDWNDWNKPVISRLKAKLFRNSTYVNGVRQQPETHGGQQTKLEIAVLKSTSNVSS